MRCDVMWQNLKNIVIYAIVYSIFGKNDTKKKDTLSAFAAKFGKLLGNEKTLNFHVVILSQTLI